MSAITGVPGGSHPAIQVASQGQQLKAAAPKVMVRDSDGDYDGTAPGQIDAKDFGKGITVDKSA